MSDALVGMTLIVVLLSVHISLAVDIRVSRYEELRDRILMHMQTGDNAICTFAYLQFKMREDADNLVIKPMTPAELTRLLGKLARRGYISLSGVEPGIVPKTQAQPMCHYQLAKRGRDRLAQIDPAVY